MDIVIVRGPAEISQGVYYEYDRDSAPLGEGGMGVIYQGYRVDNYGYRMPVAIKSIHDKIAGDPQLIERAMREASIQIDNDNLLRMYGFIQNAELDPRMNTTVYRYYMVMEHLVGVSLDKVLNGVTTSNTGIYIPLAQELNIYFQRKDYVPAITRLMKGILSGLMALHENGYIHRDIDPSNVMITIDNKIKLIDYGVCKSFSNNPTNTQQLTQPGSFLGKVNYASPELALGDMNNQNRTTDIYEVGILLYQLVVGHLPFSGTNQDVLSKQISVPVPVKDINNKGIRRIVEKATQKKQELRYATAAEMIVDIEHLENTTMNNVRVHSPAKPINIAILWPIAAILGIVVSVVLKYILGI